jgi:hypothetical protein
MVLFLFTLVLMFSLSAVLYLMVRALPRVAEADGINGSSVDGPRGLLDRWAHSELPEKIDASFNAWLLKLLRKFKVFTLKLDNAISRHLRKINHEHAVSDKKTAIDFKEISGKKVVPDSNSSDPSAED